MTPAAPRGLPGVEPFHAVPISLELALALRRERVTPDEIESVVRGAGMGALDQAGAVVLETEGTFHVLPKGQAEGSAVPGSTGLLQEKTPRDRQPEAGR